MKLATIKLQGIEIASLVTPNGIIPIPRLEGLLEETANFQGDLLQLIKFNLLEKLKLWYKSTDKSKFVELSIPFDKVKYAPLYREPSKIWGIGLNYSEHASDLAVVSPTTYPVGFMKPDTTIIGYKDQIKIPLLSNKTTGEGELGLIIGKECKDIEREDWLEYVAGFTTILDMTAEDILRQNARYLGLSKSFDTFFSFGPHMITPDEIEDLSKLNVSTVLNGEVRGNNTISNMTFPPDFLVSFHSKIMKLKPGDIISTGTPRAAHLSHGDRIECRIDGFEPLINEVIDLKYENIDFSE